MFVIDPFTPQEDEQSPIEQWFKRNYCGSMTASVAASTAQDEDWPQWPDPGASSTSLWLPQGTSCVDLVQSDVIMNQHSTVPVPSTAIVPTSKSFPRFPSDSLPANSAAGHSPRTDVLTTTQTTRSTPIESELPSRVEETLAVCPRFRIVLVGNTGVGKSSLVSSVFNVVFNVTLPSNDGTNSIDIAHDRVGKADIDYEYYSDQNPRFILHDSMGFEPGYIEKSEIVRSFLQERAGRNAKLPDQVHTIWHCIETPRRGSRFLQTADEDMLELAKNLKIPVIMVFTKYDYLVFEHFRACSHISSLLERKVVALNRAEKAFSDFTKGLKVPFAPVSTMKEMRKEFGRTMLFNLIKVTRDNLRDVEGSLWALLTTLLLSNPRQKVELSISFGLKKYWQNLGESVFFQEHRLVDCIARIRLDVLKIWNFNDPLELLSGVGFLEGMIRLVEPLSDEAIRNQPQAERVDHNEMAGLAASVVSVAGTTMAIQTIWFLQSKYQKGVSTAAYLAAYIVDLILVLYEISMVMMVDPLRSLTSDLVMDALATYKPRSSKIHAQVKGLAFNLKLEERIASVIHNALPPLCS